MNKLPFSLLSGSFNRGAREIAGIYLILGSIWILLSDRIAARIAWNEEMLAVISLYKGWGYVLVTAGLLYWLIRRHTVRLRANETRLQSVLDALPVLISYVDRDRRYQFTNQAYEAWFGERAHGKYLWEALGHTAYQKISKYVESALNGQTVRYETEIPYLDGGERYVHATYVPDIAADRKVRGFFALVQDITEQKHTQRDLRRWADAFEGCAYGIAIGDPNTNRIAVCNPAFARMHRCSVEEIVGSAILSLYAPADHEDVRRHVQKADQIGHVRFEARMMRRDRSTFPVEVDLVSVLGEDGELMYRVATAQDVSERKLMDERLKESEAKYRTLVENLPAITYISRPEQYIGASYISPQIETLGFDADTWLADPEYWFRQIHPDDQERVRSELRRFEAGVEPFRAEYRLMLPSGETRWFHDEASTVKDPGGKPILKQGFMLDITERRQAEENLRRYELLSEHSRDIMLFVRYRDGRILEANAAAARAYGYTRDELLDLTIRELRAEGTHGLTAAQMAQADAQGILFETTHRRKDGTVFPVEVSSQGASIGGVRMLVSVIRDIAERTQARQELQLKDELLRMTSEMAKVGGWEFDPQTGQGTWTDEVARIHDLDPAEPTSVEVGLSFYIGESRQEVEQAVRGAIEQGQPYDLELEMVTGRGNRKWVRTMGLPVVQDGRVVRVQGIFQDITERKQIEQELSEARAELERKVQERTAALSEANALLQALMDHIPDHIYFKDTQSRFIRSSRSQAARLGFSDPAQAVGRTDFDFFPDAPAYFAGEQEVMKSGKPLVDLEEHVVWPDGQESWVLTTKLPLRDSRGETIGIFGISHDITDRKRAEQSIRDLNADLEKKARELQAANKELEAFSYSVSHDLRAPLRAIDGYTRILLEDYEPLLDDEGRRICGVISREARRMGQLIDDLLAFSRLGRKEMYTSSMDMRSLVVGVLNELVKENERERIEFKISRLPNVKGDSALMRQVWVNLLSNAIKFTSKKEQPVIEVGSKTSPHEYIYYVRDNGAGFEMEYTDKLFGVFQRLHSESEFSGTGVGLAIVQRIVRRHGGRVWAEGEVEKGATFYFALPRKENHS